jgi:hypothetical protein
MSDDILYSQAHDERVVMLLCLQCFKSTLASNGILDLHVMNVIILRRRIKCKGYLWRSSLVSIHYPHSLSLRPYLVQMFSSEHCSHTPSVCVLHTHTKQQAESYVLYCSVLDTTLNCKAASIPRCSLPHWMQVFTLSSHVTVDILRTTSPLTFGLSSILELFLLPLSRSLFSQTEGRHSVEQSRGEGTNKV